MDAVNDTYLQTERVCDLQDTDEYVRALLDRFELEWAAGRAILGDMISHFKYEQFCSVRCSRCHNASTRTFSSTGPLSVQLPLAVHSQAKSSSRSRRGVVCTLDGTVFYDFMAWFLNDCYSDV